MRNNIEGISSIRKREGGYIVEARWPYGGEPLGYGEVICPSLEDVFKLLRKVFEGSLTGEKANDASPPPQA